MKREYTLGLYEKAIPGNMSWEEKLRLAKNAGYDFMEMSVDETEEKLARLNMTNGECLDLLALTVKTGLPIRSICLSGHRKFPLGSHDDATAARSMEIMEKAIHLAERLGVRIIQLAGYDVYYETGDDKTRARFEQNLKRSAELAAAAGVALGFETMETPFMDTTEKAMRYVSLVGSPWLGVYPDIGNMTNAAVLYGTDVLDDLRIGAGHLFAMHLKETVPGKYREIPFGTGHVDFEAAVREALALGVRRFVTEFWYTGSETWEQDLSDTAGRFRRLFEEIQEERV